MEIVSLILGVEPSSNDGIIIIIIIIIKRELL